MGVGNGGGIGEEVDGGMSSGHAQKALTEGKIHFNLQKFYQGILKNKAL